VNLHTYRVILQDSKVSLHDSRMILHDFKCNEGSPGTMEDRQGTMKVHLGGRCGKKTTRYSYETVGITINAVNLSRSNFYVVPEFFLNSVHNFSRIPEACSGIARYSAEFAHRILKNS
jgi:hypothetical protein